MVWRTEFNRVKGRPDQGASATQFRHLLRIKIAGAAPLSRLDPAYEKATAPPGESGSQAR